MSQQIIHPHICPHSGVKTHVINTCTLYSYTHATSKYAPISKKSLNVRLGYFPKSLVNVNIIILV